MKLALMFVEVSLLLTILVLLLKNTLDDFDKYIDKKIDSHLKTETIWQIDDQIKD